MYIILGGRTACWPNSVNAEGHNEIQQYRLNNFKPIGNLSLFLVKHRKMRDLHITKTICSGWKRSVLSKIFVQQCGQCSLYWGARIL